MLIEKDDRFKIEPIFREEKSRRLNKQFSNFIDELMGSGIIYFMVILKM